MHRFHSGDARPKRVLDERRALPFGALVLLALLAGCVDLIRHQTPTELAAEQCRNEPLLSKQSGVKATLTASREKLKIAGDVDIGTYQRYATELTGYDARFEQLYQVTRTACLAWIGCRIAADQVHQKPECDNEYKQYDAIQKDYAGLIAEIQSKSDKVQQLAAKTGSEPKQTPTLATASTGEQVIGFGGVDPRKSPGDWVAAAPYLHDEGISIGALRPATSKLVLVDNAGLYGGQAVHPTYSQTLLTQVDTGDGPASYELVFDKPVRSVSLTRPSLFASTPSGVTHPAWTAYAFDESGRQIAVVSEELTRSFSTVPAQTYSLVATGFSPIKRIRIDSDFRLNGKPFAAFGSLLIERITTTPFNKS